jgi:signal transduction histidine kinase|tara:strand:- start:756 stop:1163 length:408 start_codon:yes stop_codon:yes gene_type:complete
MPVVLLKFGLNEATLDLCKKYTNSELTFKLVNKHETPRFHEDFEIKTYNIIEEVTNNIIKHSVAKNAIITLNQSNNTIGINIMDNGIGFDANCTQVKNGIGLSLIKTRIKNFKGTFNIPSKINAGTKIELNIRVS